MGCSCSKASGGASGDAAVRARGENGGGGGASGLAERSKPAAVCKPLTASSQDIRDIYKIGYLLGSGAFGQVRECKRRADDAVFAVKIMERRGREGGHWSNEAMFRREVQMLGLLKHANIIEYLDFYEDQHFLYAVMERCYGGELFGQIIRCKRFLENDASYLCRQMLLAVQYCHQRGIIHRDIKAENFLFKTTDMASDLKLIDFGMAACIGPKVQVLSEVCGSPHYLSPELVRRRYNSKADMWALGVLIYLMLFGRYPFDSSSTDAIIRQILKCNIDWKPGNVAVSEDALSFMQTLLVRDPKKRLSAAEALEHSWIKNSETPEQWKRRKIAEQNLRKRKEAGDLLAQVKRAHRRVSRNKKTCSHRLDSRRNFLLKRLERDWQHGNSTCVRVLPNTPPNRPEYVRRDVRHNTTPGRPPGSSLADLQALRRHIEHNCGEAPLAQQQQSCAPTEGLAVGSAALAVVTPATTSATKRAHDDTDDDAVAAAVSLARQKFETGSFYDWEAHEESLRQGHLEGEFSLEPRRAVTVTFHQQEVFRADL